MHDEKREQLRRLNWENKMEIQVTSTDGSWDQQSRPHLQLLGVTDGYNNLCFSWSLASKQSFLRSHEAAPGFL